jgi:hypothetical protein
MADKIIPYAPKSGETQCLESQEWTYGIDNTGTRFNDVADYELTLSDGSTIAWSQDGSDTGWAAQLTSWAAGIQAAANNAGLLWFVEPRFIDNFNPANIDGTINGPGGTPSGLPGAPTTALAQELFSGGMFWRYVNFQVCPGQPVPVSARRINSTIYTNNPYELAAAGPILGAVQEFRVCESCVEGEIDQRWFIRDDAAKPAGYVGVFFRPATAGEIPNCYFPCGFLSLQPEPPSRNCEFQFDTACDDLGQSDPLNYQNLITRRVTYCNGQQIGQDFFSPDPGDPAALVDYALVGSYVDCATGSPVPLPVPPCNDFELTTLYRMDGGGARDTWRRREWFDLGPGFREEPVTLDGANGFLAQMPLENGMPTPAGPSDTDTTSSNFNYNDTTNAGAPTDVELKEGYIVVDKPFLIRSSQGGSEKYVGIWLGVDGGLPQNIYEFAHDQSAGFANQGDAYGSVPAGNHFIRLMNYDVNGTNASGTIEISLDGGATWLPNTQAPWSIYETPPCEVCMQVKVCKDTGALIDLLTNDVYDPADVRPCALPSSAMLACLGEIKELLSCDGVTACHRTSLFHDADQLDAGDTETYEIAIDGDIVQTIIHDHTTTFDGINRSTMYTPVISALNGLANWTFTLLSESGPVQPGKQEWQVDYDGPGDETLEVRLHGDVVRWYVDADGVLTAQAFDSGSPPASVTEAGIDFSSPIHRPCA